MAQLLPNQTFAPAVAGFLTKLGSVAEEQSLRAFLVGGMVRDALLGAHSSEIDLLIEGDAPGFARSLKEDWEKHFPELPTPKQCIRFKRYQTAKLKFGKEVLPGVLELDFASTRGESYPVPGGKPDVWPAALEQDLARRDFTINAMAVGLSGAEYGRIFDYHDGLRHLREKKLVLLHEQSFRDDPVRIIRALRFVGRFGFEIDRPSEELMEEAIDGEFLATVSPQRLFDELRKALSDEPIRSVVAQLKDKGVLRQLLPARAGGARAVALLSDYHPGAGRAAPLGAEFQWQGYAAVLCAEIPHAELRAWLEAVGCGPSDMSNILNAHQKLAALKQA